MDWVPFVFFVWFFNLSLFGMCLFIYFFPQITIIAIGVLTSNTGEGEKKPLRRIGRGTRVPLLGVIVGYHCSVLWVTTNFGGADMVPLLGDDQLWGSGHGAIAGWRPTLDVVPIFVSVSYFPPIFRATNFTHTPKKTTMDFVLSFLRTLHCSRHW